MNYVLAVVYVAAAIVVNHWRMKLTKSSMRAGRDDSRAQCFMMLVSCYFIGLACHAAWGWNADTVGAYLIAVTVAVILLIAIVSFRRRRRMANAEDKSA